MLSNKNIHLLLHKYLTNHYYYCNKYLFLILKPVYLSSPEQYLRILQSHVAKTLELLTQFAKYEYTLMFLILPKM